MSCLSKLPGRFLMFAILFMQSEAVWKLKCDKILFICPGISCILITVTPICQMLIVSNPYCQVLIKITIIKAIKNSNKINKDISYQLKVKTLEAIFNRYELEKKLIAESKIV